MKHYTSSPAVTLIHQRDGSHQLGHLLFTFDEVHRTILIRIAFDLQKPGQTLLFKKCW